MATNFNTEGRVSSKYPGKFNARENRLISTNYAAVSPSESGETIVIAEDGSITHVIVDKELCTIQLPKAELSVGRLLKVFVKNSVTSVAVVQDLGSTTLEPGTYEFMCLKSPEGLPSFDVVSASAPIPDPAP